MPLTNTELSYYDSNVLRLPADKRKRALTLTAAGCSRLAAVLEALYEEAKEP